MSLWSKWSNFVDLGFGSNAPAIWLYPPKPTEVSVKVHFHGEGFMTMSSPAYNQGWIVQADASDVLPKATGVYSDEGTRTFLDYDGFRDGQFQTDAGWVVEKKDLLKWQQSKLAELGYRENEIADVNYTYGRLLLMRDYPQRYFLVYPQTASVLNDSVSLHISPQPDTLHRLWLYFVPSDDPPKMAEPKLEPLTRRGFTAVELGFLTDSEMPAAAGASGAASDQARQARPKRSGFCSPRLAR
jgi:hypothetical protein